MRMLLALFLFVPNHTSAQILDPKQCLGKLTNMQVTANYGGTDLVIKKYYEDIKDMGELEGYMRCFSKLKADKDDVGRPGKKVYPILPDNEPSAPKVEIVDGVRSPVPKPLSEAKLEAQRKKDIAARAAQEKILIKEEYIDDYIREYRHYLNAATSAFGAPREIVACMGMRESLWMLHATSSSGAKGLMQAMDKETTKTTGALDQFNKAITDPNNVTARLEFEQYYKTLFVQGSEQLKKGTPGKLMPRDMYVPHLSLAVGAYYTAWALPILDKILVNYHFKEKISPLEIGLFVAAMYNMGPTGFASALKASARPSKDPNIVKKEISKDWYKSAYFPEETRLHVQSQKNCMQRGNMAPPENFFGRSSITGLPLPAREKCVVLDFK